MSLLDTIKPFVDAGFGIHWLHPREKRPIGDNWQERPVASFDTLKRRMVPDCNVGVRLGEFSRVEGGFLYVLDVDIRKVETAAAAWAKLASLFPGVALKTLPTVISGSGGESRHIYFISDRPFRSSKLAKSEAWTMVFDPKKGRDVKKHDWEIELFGAPKQVAMPPSIHPDSGKPYRWEREFDLFELELGCGPTISGDAVAAAGANDEVDDDFESNGDRLGITHDEAREILEDIPFDEWCEDRDGWFRVGMALKHEFGEDGYELWVEYSVQSTKFDEREQKAVWKSFKGKTKRACRMATLLAAANAVRLKREIDGLDDLDDGDDEDDFGDLLTSDSSTPKPVANDDWDGGELTEDEKKLPWTSLLGLDAKGEKIATNLHNMELIVKNDPRVAGLPQMNLFTRETVQRTQPGVKQKKRANAAKETRQLTGPVWDVRDTLNGEIWSTARDYAIRSILEAPQTQGGYGIKVTDRDLKGATVLAAWENCFHPVREYLDGLTWDGTDRIEQLFVKYLGCEDSAYTREVGRLMMIAGVARVFEPGCKWDYAVILEGLQGAGKSTFIRVLGKQWFSELDGDFHNGKEMVEKMQGSWIVEIPELSGFSKADVQSIKAFISRQTDKVRLAYEARAEDFPRQCILIGSTNDKEYLRDATGGRRFFPMECRVKSIDNVGLRRDVDHLWAEAVHKYREMREATPMGQGDLPLYMLNANAVEEAARLQESRRVESADDALAGQIAAWLSAPVQTGSIDDDMDDGKPRYRTETCLIEIWCDCLGNERKNYGQVNAQMIGRAMRLITGWSLGNGKTRFERYGQQRFYTKGNDAERSGRMGLLKFD